MNAHRLAGIGIGLLLTGLAVATCVAPPPQAALQPQPQEVATSMCVRTLNIAHRGARSLAPENTLAAARKAFEIGADMWEIDVAMTADGVPFIVHDDTLLRTSNAQAVFPERKPHTNQLFTWDDVQRLDFGSWFVTTDPFKQIAAGNVSPAEQDGYRGEKAPSLRQALTFTKERDWRVNVEIKDLTGAPGDATVVEAVVALIDELAMADRVLISSFNHAYLARVKRTNPSLTTGALVERAVADPAALLRRLDAQAYNPKVGQITETEIGKLRDAGFDVYIWTVNDEATMQRLVAARVSGIFTDFPQLLKPLVGDCQ